MAGGLVGLFDDVAALAKLAASSIDDVGAAAGRASMKAAGVVVDDAAVTPQYVQGLAAERELPIIKKIARGSLLNKLAFILPAAILLGVVFQAPDQTKRYGLRMKEITKAATGTGGFIEIPAAGLPKVRHGAERAG